MKAILIEQADQCIIAPSVKKRERGNIRRGMEENTFLLTHWFSTRRETVLWAIISSLMARNFKSEGRDFNSKGTNSKSEERDFNSERRNVKSQGRNFKSTQWNFESQRKNLKSKRKRNEFNIYG